MALEVASGPCVAGIVVGWTDDHIKTMTHRVFRYRHENLFHISLVALPVASVEMRRLLRRLEAVVVRPVPVVRQTNHVAPAALLAVRKACVQRVVVLERALDRRVVAPAAPVAAVEERMDALHHAHETHAVPLGIDKVASLHQDGRRRGCAPLGGIQRGRSDNRHQCGNRDNQSFRHAKILPHPPKTSNRPNGL